MAQKILTKEPIVVDRDGFAKLQTQLPAGHTARILQGWKGEEIEVLLPKIRLSRDQNLADMNARAEAAHALQLAQHAATAPLTGTETRHDSEARWERARAHDALR